MNHLRRKNKCINKLSNDLQEEYIKYNITEKINYTQNIPKNDDNIPKISSKNTQKKKIMNVNIVIKN